MSEGWVEVTTCGSVSSGRCNKCKEETFYAAYKRPVEGNCPLGWPLKETLCVDCYQAVYEPEKAAAKKAAIAQAEAERKRDLELALQGKLPGAIVKENGCVLGPPINGSPYRRVLQEGTFDTELLQIPPMTESLSKNFFMGIVEPTKKVADGQ